MKVQACSNATLPRFQYLAGKFASEPCLHPIIQTTCEYYRTERGSAGSWRQLQIRDESARIHKHPNLIPGSGATALGSVQ
jgi:hypothetical protein